MAEATMLLLTCPCGQELQTKAENIGQRVACTKCGRKIPVTGKNTRPMPAASAGAGPGPGAGPVTQEGQRKLLGQMLVEEGLITPHELDQALKMQAQQGGKLAETLIKLGYLRMREFVDFLSHQPGMASIDIFSYNLSDRLTQYVPKALALRHDVFPIDKLGKLLTVAMGCPLDTKAIQELQEVSGHHVKPLLCSPDDIHAAIMRYYPRDSGAPVRTAPTPAPREPVTLAEAQSTLIAQGISKMIGQLTNLPVLLQTAERVKELAGDVETPLVDLADTIAMDPPAAAVLLREANQHHYGFTGRVASLEQAVLLIGMHRTREIILDAPPFDFRIHADAFDYKTFWMEAMCCASLAEKIASITEKAPAHVVYFAGLMHDIGRMVLFNVAPELYSRPNLEAVGADLAQAERGLMGLAHTDAGFELAQDWNLPDALAQALRCHHEPEDAQGGHEIVAIVGVASELARADKPSGTAFDKLYERCQEHLGLLGLTEDEADEVLDEIMDAARTRILWTPMWSSLIGEATGYF